MCVIDITTLTVTNGVPIDDDVEYQYKLQSSETWSATKITTFSNPQVEDIIVIGDYDLRVRVKSTTTGLAYSAWATDTFSVTYSCLGNFDWEIDFNPLEEWDGQFLPLWYIVTHTDTTLNVNTRIDTLPIVVGGGDAPGTDRATICAAFYGELWAKTDGGIKVTPEPGSSIVVTNTLISC